MRLALITVVLGFFTSFAQSIPNINGTWTGTSSFGNGDRQMSIDLVMQLQKDGDHLTGSISPAGNDKVRLEISNGKFDGNSVTFDLIEPARPDVKMSIKGRIDNGRAEGDFSALGNRGVTVDGKGSGPFTGTEMTLEWSAVRGDKSEMKGKLHFTRKTE